MKSGFPPALAAARLRAQEVRARNSSGRGFLQLANRLFPLTGSGSGEGKSELSLAPPQAQVPAKAGPMARLPWAGDRRCPEPSSAGSKPGSKPRLCQPPNSESELDAVSLPCVQPSHAVNPPMGIWGRKTPLWPRTGFQERHPPLRSCTEGVPGIRRPLWRQRHAPLQYCSQRPP